MTVGRDPLKRAPVQVTRTVHAAGRRAAERALSALEEEVREGRHGGASTTVGYVLDEWVRHMPATRSPRTIHEARRTVDTVLAPLRPIRLRELTPRHVDELYRRLAAEGHKPASRRRYHACLAAALNQAVRWGWLERSPMDRVNKPQVPSKTLRIPSEEERWALIRLADEANPAYGALLRLAVITGARRGELCALRWIDAETIGDAVVLQIRRSLYRAGAERGEKVTKTDRERMVVLDPASADWLAAWRRRCEEAAVGTLAADAFIAAASPDGRRPVNPDSLSSHVHRSAKALGIGHVHLHSLRHVAGTELIGAGIDPRTAADIMGHDPSVLLGIYAHGSTERQRGAAAVLGRLLPPALPAATS